MPELNSSRRLRGGTVAAAALACTLCLGGCINVASERGVEARWRDLSPDAFERGVTTRAQVLDALGPPSQILSLAEGAAFYYMLEQTTGKGLVLLVFNTRTESTTYDRAVFFFDEAGLLTDYAVSEADS